MVTIKSTYLCDACGEEHNTIEKAEACEKIPTQCPLFDVGNKVRVTTGQGRGEIVEIVEWNYIKPSYYGERRVHEIVYTGEFDNGDTRILIEGIDCEAV
jgi:hypothetical protein